MRANVKSARCERERSCNRCGRWPELRTTYNKCPQYRRSSSREANEAETSFGRSGVRRLSAFAIAPCPGSSRSLSGARAVSALRPIQIQDLLRRRSDRDRTSTRRSIVRHLAANGFLVTGAGGSIGSELCRQLAQLAPQCIVALGRGENSIFELLEELRARRESQGDRQTGDRRRARR